MTVYIIIAFLLMFFVLFSKSEATYLVRTDGTIVRRKNSSTAFQRGYLILLLIFFMVITGLRAYYIGNDTTQYVYFFNSFKDGNFDPEYRIEIGYQLFCYLVGRFTSDPHVFLVIYSVICYSIFGYFIFKNSKNIPLSLCMLFCLFFGAYMNIMRQGLAILLLLGAISYLRKDRFIRASLLILIAGTLHATAFLLLILLLYKVFPRSLKFYLISFIVVLAITFSNSLYFIVDRILPQYSHYFGGKYDSSGFLAVGFYLTIGISIFLASYVCYARDKTNTGKIVMMCNYLMVISYTLSFSLNLLTRFAQYFLAISVIFLPNAIMTYKHKKLWSVLLAIILIVYFFVIMIYRTNWNVLYPYHFYWEVPNAL